MLITKLQNKAVVYYDSEIFVTNFAFMTVQYTFVAISSRIIFYNELKTSLAACFYNTSLNSTDCLYNVRTKPRSA